MIRNSPQTIVTLHLNKLLVLDEAAALLFRCSSLNNGVLRISTNDHQHISETEDVSILNLPSLKKGNMMSKSASAKLELILEDKERLNYWIKNYKVHFEETCEKDSVKIAIFREATTRLKMLLDHSDFDEGDYRIARREAIMEINDMLISISGL